MNAEADTGAYGSDGTTFTGRRGTIAVQVSLDWMAAALSFERLRPYLDECGDQLDVALRMYTWNTEIAGAFHGPLDWLEIVLRNGLHHELKREFGRGDWWNSPRIRLRRHALDQIAEANRKLGTFASSAPAGKLVAELSLGFWVALVSAGRGGFNYETTLWRPALRFAFSAYRGRRAPLHRDLESVRLLRNRIAHCEPVHRRHLHADHETVIRLIGYLSPNAAQHVRCHSRVPEVLARRAGVCDGTAEPSF
ncbi:MAG: hypothetical protein ACRDQ5_08940 [Sciscionella sp.]